MRRILYHIYNNTLYIILTAQYIGVHDDLPQRLRYDPVGDEYQRVDQEEERAEHFLLGLYGLIILPEQRDDHQVLQANDHVLTVHAEVHISMQTVRAGVQVHEYLY